MIIKSTEYCPECLSKNVDIKIHLDQEHPLRTRCLDCGEIRYQSLISIEYDKPILKIEANIADLRDTVLIMKEIINIMSEIGGYPYDISSGLSAEERLRRLKDHVNRYLGHHPSNKRESEGIK